MKVLIIGAGPAGCALAQGLKKENIDFAIFDKSPSLHRNRHWAFTLGWARPHLLSMLPEEIGARLSSAQCDPSIDCAAIGEDRIVLYNGKTREEAFTFPIPQAREINIRQLRQLCAAGLDVQYDKKFERFEILDEGGVRVWFADGSSEVGDIVVGVDGANSQVRHALLGDKAIPESLPFALMNFNTSYTAEQALFVKKGIHPLVDIAIHPANHYIRTNVLDMLDAKDPSTWTFQILTTWPFKNVEDWDNETDRLKRLKEHVKRQEWAEPYRSAIEWIPEDTPILKDQLKIWKTVKWDNHGGRVTLTGDAAHAMTFRKWTDPPFTDRELTRGSDRGQGGNNALYSASCFFEAIKSVHSGTQSLQQAVDEYDEKILKRGQHEVQISKSQSFFTHDWENFINSPVIKLGTRPSHDAHTEGYQS